MAKMTKEQAVEMLKNRKVYVNGKSKEIQEKLFDLGWKWGNGDTVILFVDKPFIYIYSEHITWGENMDEFSEDEKKEISAEEIQSIEIQKECAFKPFDKVLGRDVENQVWNADIFSHFDEENKLFRCLGGCGWVLCIPYESNEHLLGTTANPKDKEE